MKTAFSRTFIPVAMVLLSALLLVGCLFQYAVKNYLEEKVRTDLEADGATIADMAAAYYAQDILSSREFLSSLSAVARVSGTDAAIFDSTGKLLLCSDSPLGCAHQGMYLSQEYLQRIVTEKCVFDQGTIDNLYEDVRYVVAVPVLDPATQETVGAVIVSALVSDTLTVLTWLSDRYFMISVLVIIIAVFTMTLLVRRQSTPLRAMARAASAFGHGDLDARVQVDSSTSQEMQELALAFNNMASSLQKSEYQRQEFVANVSHELKTPMTTISGFVDGMLDGTIPPEKHRQYMALVSDETKRLSRLVRSMLDISRLQGGIPEEQKLRFDMGECAGRVLITFEQKITEKSLDVEVDFPEHPVFTHADPDAITQVVYNLVDNAVKFSPQGGSLGLRIREGAGKVYVSVSNEGTPIPPEELPLVFDRFHKLDKSRSQNRDSWGLGLYIVKTLVCSHGEDISVSSHDGKTEFTFTVPLVT